MKRKLVKLGPSTLVISLPKKWLERMNLKMGDEIDVEEGPSLNITAKYKPNYSETKVFDLENVSANITEEFMVGIHKAGIVDATLNNVTKEKEKNINNVISKVTGFQIMDHSNNSTRINDIGIIDETQLKKLEQQVYWKLLKMIDETADSKKKYEDLHKTDNEINKLAFLIQRKIGVYFPTNNESFLNYEKIVVLEFIGDSLKLYKTVASKKDVDVKSLQTISQIVEGLRYLETKTDETKYSQLKSLIAAQKNRLLKARPAKNDYVLVIIYNYLGNLLEIVLALHIKDFMEPS
jgi:phosphate uptake regulator